MKSNKVMKRLLAYICAVTIVIANMAGYKAVTTGAATVPSGYTLQPQDWVPLGTELKTLTAQDGTVEHYAKWSIYAGSWSGSTVATKGGSDADETLSLFVMSRDNWDVWALQAARIFVGLTPGAEYDYSISWTEVQENGATTVHPISGTETADANGMVMVKFNFEYAAVNSYLNVTSATIRTKGTLPTEPETSESSTNPSGETPTSGGNTSGSNTGCTYSFVDAHESNMTNIMNDYLGTENGVENYARRTGISATASSQSDDAHPAQTIVNYNSTDRWQSNTAQDTPQWAAVDLGQKFEIKTVKLVWEATQAVEFEIQVSDTGAENSYTTVAALTVEKQSNFRVDTIVLNNTYKTQYIRIYMTKNNNGTSTDYKLYKIGLYGTAGTTPGGETPSTGETTPGGETPPVSGNTSGCTYSFIDAHESNMTNIMNDYLSTENGVENYARRVDVTATASSQSDDAHKAQIIVDYNSTDRWQSNTAQDTPQWVAVDLGQKLGVKTVKLVWEATQAVEYEVQVSDTGEENSYTTVAALAVEKQGNFRVDTIVLNDTYKTQYIRIYMTKNNNGTSTDYKLYKIGIYGTAGTTPGDETPSTGETTPDKETPSIGTTVPGGNETTTPDGTEQTTASGIKQTTVAPETTKTATETVSVGKTKVKKVTKKLAAKKAKISLKKISGAQYQVKVSTTKKFKKKNTITKKVKKAKFVIKSKKIKGKKTLYVKARAYKIVNGKPYYGKWSKVKKIKIKK